MSRSPEKHSYLLFELTKRCQNSCVFCYNVWKETASYPQEELDTDGTIAILDRVIDATRCKFIGLTGGEPLLKEGVLEIAAHISARGVAPVLISNGKLLAGGMAERLVAAGVRYFEVSLHSHQEAVHDRLVGRRGSFQEALDAILAVKAAGGQVNTVFVATNDNIGSFKEYIELNALLRVDWILFNRVACGGTCIASFTEMAPPPAALEAALRSCAPLAERYRIGISVGVQIQPCLVDLGDIDNIRTGFCPLNGSLKDNSYFVVDPAGNLRMCNRSRTILGNLQEHRFAELLGHPAIDEICAAIPEICHGCKLAETCAGGCKADALSCFGTLDRPDPYLEVWRGQAREGFLREE
jgi:radical SAM protein with 4Fe4S-binding SPASM domain